MAKKNLYRIIIIDILMIVILGINLFWILFDWIFKIQTVASFFKTELNGFYEWYLPIHHHFYLYDLIFVGIFVTEIIIRWIIAIKNKTYYKWFFYPFVHWYDVLGCIPVGGWVMLRFLRIISIIYRLHKLEIIDITKNYLYQKANKYYNIIVEEISDRVVINVLNGIQEEVSEGTPVAERIIDEVIKPHKDILIKTITLKLQTIISETYPEYSDELKVYIKDKVKTSVLTNKELKILGKVPILGNSAHKIIERSVSNTVYDVINSLISDIVSDESTKRITNISSDVFDKFLNKLQEDINDVSDKIIIESIEIIKDQVKVQNWKVKEIDEKMRKMKDSDDSDDSKILKKIEELKRQRLLAKIKDPLFGKRPNKK